MVYIAFLLVVGVVLGWGSTPEVHFVLRNYAVRYGKAKRFVLRIIQSFLPFGGKEKYL